MSNQPNHVTLAKLAALVVIMAALAYVGFSIQVAFIQSVAGC